MRIYYSSWGWKQPWRDRVKDSYVLAPEFRTGDISGKIAGALERQTGLVCCAGPKAEHTEVTREGKATAYCYSITLGSPCPGGGFIPRTQVWFNFKPPMEE